MSKVWICKWDGVSAEMLCYNGNTFGFVLLINELAMTESLAKIFVLLTSSMSILCFYVVVNFPQ